MLNFSTRLGRRMNRRLRQEQIIWLTTVDSHNTPQPRPVWFHWDGETVLIYSETDTAKLRHIARNPRVALNFNTDESGGEVGVLIGEAEVSKQAIPGRRLQAYLRKYSGGITDLGMTPRQFTADFSVPILVTLRSMRGE